MRNAIGVLLTALGAGLAAGAFSLTVALVVTGVILAAGSLVLIIDWPDA